MPHATGSRNARFKHGHNGKHGRSRTYKAWDSMVQRCTNPKIPNYHRYGGRGIIVCDRWLVFANFLADMGECPPDLSIDRIDNNLGYEPSNCRWATRLMQSRNSSKPKAIIRSDGKRYDAFIDAAIDTGVHYTAIVKCCTGSRKSAGGFKWRYALEDK